MVFWAEELTELTKKVSDKMETMAENSPKDEKGIAIAGTPEVIAFNKGVFALAGCVGKLMKLLQEMD